MVTYIAKAARPITQPRLPGNLGRFLAMNPPRLIKSATDINTSSNEDLRFKLDNISDRWWVQASNIPRPQAVVDLVDNMYVGLHTAQRLTKGAIRSHL